MRSFQTENGFMRHFCAERERLEELKSPRGQAAYQLYGEWMREQKRSVPPADRFMASRQYKNFIKFVDWAEKTSIPNTAQFVKIMVQTETQPVLWCRDTTYSMYLQWYDHAYPPHQQFIETYDALQVLALEYEVPLSSIYPALGVKELCKLVRRRRLSPWLLAISPNFLGWIKSLAHTDLELVNEAVNFAAYWQKINEQPALAHELRTACEELNV